MNCLQPGCTGQIAEGYCDICGMPPSSAPEPPSAPVRAATPAGTPDSSGTHPSTAAASAAAASASTTSPSVRPGSVPPGHTGRGRPGIRPTAPTGTCKQPGCPGRIRDGYCDVCGSPATAATPPPADSTVTRASTHLGVTALGSQRVLTSPTGTQRTRVSARMRSQRLGAGLTTVPPAPAVDPASAVMTDPVVPESRRNCPHCGTAVGRSVGNQPGRTEGFCPNCRKPYSFDAKLKAGDLVANQYRIAGPLAHGGMGWIYLAQDQNVSDRWVVLKGLLNAGDADALAATISEQRFLAQVGHPLIVEIYNFVTHDGAGYIVMEYVGGRSLKQLLQQRREANGGVHDPLPVDQALAYILEVLPAFSYLHDLGLLYCDFKPDNVIQVGDSLKLIDLGGVRRIDDDHSPIFGTVGYQAPEVPTLGPSIASDIYTIGRTILVLVAEVKGYQDEYEHSLPPVDRVPAFATHDSLYRLVQKCTATAPADRFGSIDELRVQVFGVLREVVAARTPGVATSSAASLLFEPPLVSGDRFDWRQLPHLRPDSTDPNYAWLASLGTDQDPADLLGTLAAPPSESPEVLLARGDAALHLGRHDVVRQVTNTLLTIDPWEWRAVWLAGLAALINRDWKTAQDSFNAVYGQVPGELAPKLALAVACEEGGEPDIAEGLYQICASTDANYVTPAGFGLARIRAERRDLAGTLAALDLIPSTSRGFGESRRLKAEHLLALGTSLDELSQAMRLVHTSRLDPPAQAEFEVQILERAAAHVAQHGARPGASLGDQPATPDLLRSQLEQAYRRLAQFTTDPAERTTLVELANQSRKWSLI